MKEKHILARLASLEIKPGELLSREYRAWRKGLSDEDLLDWTMDFGMYVQALGIPLEQLSQLETIGEARREALVLYAQALWKAYALGPEVKERVSRNRSSFLLKLQTSEESAALRESLLEQLEALRMEEETEA
jgi:hypothetical protein